MLDYLINGRNYDLSISPMIGVAYLGQNQHETRAKHMLRLWQEFEKHERATGVSLGGRGNRFMNSMAGLLKEDEAKFRQKLRRMCKHDDNLLGIFETG